jgi:uncharacterized protein YcbX
MATVSRLNVTPVKSTALHHPDRIRIERWGAVGNREFFFLDEAGRLFGGSKLGPLVRIRAGYDAETDVLRLDLPDGIRLEGTASADGETLELAGGGRSTPTSSTAQGRALPATRRDLPGTGRPPRRRQRHPPVTLVSLASVRELARWGADGLLDRRFRMTIELDGLGAREDSWAGYHVRVGTTLVVGEPVPRCVVDLDPATGEQTSTLSVIKRYAAHSRRRAASGCTRRCSAGESGQVTAPTRR